MPIDPFIRFDKKGLVHKPQLTQGAIIQGLKFPSYSEKSYHGFLITARCDLAQLKTNTLNFLPIVPLEEWLQYSCAVSILQRRVLSLSQKIFTQIQKLDSALLSFFRDELDMEVFNGFVKENENYGKSDRNNIETQLINYTNLLAILGECRTHHDVKFLLTKHELFSKLYSRNKAKRIKDAIRNEDADVHYLPAIDTSSDLFMSDGYIVLLRHIISIPAEFFEMLEYGRLEFDIEDHINDYLIAPAGVISNIRSPHVEHILQRFSLLYSRIGVEDYSEVYVEKFASRFCNMEEN